jgi:cation transport protein ChaC
MGFQIGADLFRLVWPQKGNSALANDDPFRHHPALRPLITPREDSFFKDFRVEKPLAMLEASGLATDWLLSDVEREACRAGTLAGRNDQDLWVFGYGSLMWDPGMRFTEVRRADAPQLARRFILFDTQGGRGTRDAPGLMAALDDGNGCHGLVFRLAARDVDTETYSLWSRERIGPAYQPAFVEVLTEHGVVEALTFVADHSADQIHTDLTHDEQVRYCATGTGLLGSSRAYLENLAKHLEVLRIEDAEIDRLLTDVRAWTSD